MINKDYEIDPEYEVIDGLIDTDGVDDIEANSLFCIYCEGLENEG